MDSHVSLVCHPLQIIIEDEMGNQFYLASLANTLNLSLYDIILQEEKKMSTLGKYQLR